MNNNNFISKDKSRRNLEKEEFQLRSRLFFIYPEYNKVEGAQNFDICLIKTASDEYGVHLDLSSKLDAIPCLPDEIDLKKVQSFIRLHTFEVSTLGYYESHRLRSMEKLVGSLVGDKLNQMAFHLTP